MTHSGSYEGRGVVTFDLALTPPPPRELRSSGVTKPREPVLPEQTHRKHWNPDGTPPRAEHVQGAFFRRFELGGAEYVPARDCKGLNVRLSGQSAGGPALQNYYPIKYRTFQQA